MLYTAGIFTRRKNQAKDILYCKERKVLNVDVNDIQIHLSLSEIYVGEIWYGINMDTRKLDDDALESPELESGISTDVKRTDNFCTVIQTKHK